jgi:hypothetical protein
MRDVQVIAGAAPLIKRELGNFSLKPSNHVCTHVGAPSSPCPTLTDAPMTPMTTSSPLSAFAKNFFTRNPVPSYALDDRITESPYSQSGFVGSESQSRQEGGGFVEKALWPRWEEEEEEVKEVRAWLKEEGR